MGQRGPAPQPRNLLLLKGEQHKDRLERAPAPQDPPDKPRGMDREASKVWERVLAATSDTQHIGQAHAEALRQYCELTAQINAMQPKGGKEWRELVLVHLRLARELCLTPATSSSLVRKAQTEDKLAKYLA